jgi:ubiquinone/menaquinone biosynthesis C-methylase UbiE
MGEKNLLDLYPRAKRNLEKRAEVKDKDRRLARQFGKEYFDGSRNQGYGGYKYDGRWKPIVRRFAEHYKLPEDASILDIGSGKGFMLHDFHEFMPKAKLAGIDISMYGVENTMEDVKPFVQVGNAKQLPYPDKSFDLVVAINTIHNLDREECFEAVKELERVGRGGKFLTVDAYHNEEEKKRMYMWNLTAKTIMSVDEWVEFFKKAGYTGDYYWFIP